ncbi:hypothetical protein [Rhodococcus wratislaviensis]|uniref:Uncharacterized protein n=1 Tax=Rhodococcus wratislaviensis NBRC 100605 TaxID=1219028 RepID=X0PVA8_RHOWR|nr:hypothetical protein [Rhodococcus wratislaviensis]GAF47189.1 hypothetical protein RW1_038_01110 [Rhodococcus wratislaviensis NBRC 100605]
MNIPSFIADFYWTTGWGNVATVTVAAAGIWITTWVTGRRFEFDKEQDRRTLQRQPMADVIEAYLEAEFFKAVESNGC